MRSGYKFPSAFYIIIIIIIIIIVVVVVIIIYLFSKPIYWDGLPLSRKQN